MEKFSSSQKITIRFSMLFVMILIAAFSRILPHMPNFSPLGAIGVFGAAYFTKKWQTFLIPILSTWLSDLFINNVIYAQYYPTFTWFYQGFYWQYGSYLFITFISVFLLKKISSKRIIMATLCSTIFFFFITNFGCWIDNTAYPQDFAGLISCYVAGLPFLKGTFLGDVFYSTILFGTFAWAQRQYPVLQLNYERV